MLEGMANPKPSGLARMVVALQCLETRHPPETSRPLWKVHIRQPWTHSLVWNRSVGAIAWLLAGCRGVCCSPQCLCPPIPVGMRGTLANLQVGLSLSLGLPVNGPRQGSEHGSPHLQNKDYFLSKRLLENSEMLCANGLASRVRHN